MSWRDAMCGDVLPDRVGSRLTLAGWADARRDHGGLVFVDLRDSSGVCQLVINPERAPGAAEAAHAVRNEFVLRAEGEVVRRAPENVNPDLPTGEVELQVDALEIVSRCPPLPFQLDEEGVDETLRIRYRWIDLRRGRLQRNIRMRAQMISIIRREMDAAGFVEIETPVMAKPTPEGARDFLVPTRLQPGRFRSRRRSTSSCSSSRASSATTRSPAASGTRTCGPTASRRSPSWTSRWRSPTARSSSASLSGSSRPCGASASARSSARRSRG
jgi:aspartyl-tRNA synthetase